MPGKIEIHCTCGRDDLLLIEVGKHIRENPDHIITVENSEAYG